MGDEKRHPLRIPVEQAKSRAEDGSATFLDVVDPGAYEKIDYKIKGALRIDPREIEEEYERLPRQEDILAYCT
ncbi:MAG: rhodanese-like domain-containing protein [Anaerolineales bacterium]